MIINAKATRNFLSVAINSVQYDLLHYRASIEPNRIQVSASEKIR